MHHTKYKGDVATAKVIADLTEKEYQVFIPVVTEHCRFDLIAFKDDKFWKIQAKYSSDGIATSKTSWNDKNGNHKSQYEVGDFDYYGMYLPDIGKVVYPSIKFAGKTITTKVPNSATSFYWYEDFLDFTDEAQKKTYKDFGVEHFVPWNKGKPGKRKVVNRPDRETLQKLINELGYCGTGRIYGVSDNAVRKWVRAYERVSPEN